jgi:hypothetical protein
VTGTARPRLCAALTSSSESETGETLTTTTETQPDVWELCENPPAGCTDTAELYHWSTNYDAGKGPFTLFADLIGWSEDNIGEPLYELKAASLGYVELDKLGAALREYADRPLDVRRFVDALIAAESA